MTHAEALDRASSRNRKAVAIGLGLSLTIVDAWCRDERPSPFQRSEDATLALRAAESDASELPVTTLLDRLGYLPPVRREDVREAASASEAADLMRATADALNANADAISDGMTPAEALALDAALARLSYVVTREREALARMDLDSTAERVGPKRAPRQHTASKRATA